jgi:hypothetical protein
MAQSYAEMVAAAAAKIGTQGGSSSEETTVDEIEIVSQSVSNVSGQAKSGLVY